MIKQELLEAKKIYEAGQIDLAIIKLEKILKNISNDISTLSFLGALYAKKGNYFKAKFLLEKTLQIKDDDYDSSINLIYVLNQLKEYGALLKITNSLIEKYPDDYWINLNYATALSKNGNANLGVKYLNKCISLDNKNWLAWYNLGIAYQELKEFKIAKEKFYQAQIRNPNFIDIKIKINNCLLELCKYEEIIKNFYIKREVNNYQICLQVGLSYAKLNKLDYALKYFNLSNNLSPSNYFVKFNLAKCNYRLGNLVIALELFTECLLINNNCKESNINILVILNELRKYQESIAYANKILKYFPDDKDILINLGKAYLSQTNYEKALDYINKALAIDPDNMLALFNKATILQGQKKYEMALNIYLKLLEKDKSNYNIQNNISISYLSSSNFEMGWKYYDARWKKKNANGKYIDTRLPEFNIKYKKNKKTFIWREQGLGDEVLFASMYGNLKDILNEFTIQVDSRLLTVFKRSFPDLNFVSASNKILQKNYNQQLPTGSLGKFLRKNNKDFENQNKKYIYSDSKIVESIKNKICINNNKICGITWKSNNSEIGTAKSFSLNDIVPLLKLPNYTFISLQYGDVSDEIAEFNIINGTNLINIKEIDHFNDLESHIALIDMCDLLVLSSNSTAHLSGALGKRTYIIAPKGNELPWYWNNSSSDGNNLWYPTVKIFLQKEPNEWAC